MSIFRSLWRVKIHTRRFVVVMEREWERKEREKREREELITKESRERKRKKGNVSQLRRKNFGLRRLKTGKIQIKETKHTQNERSHRKQWINTMKKKEASIKIKQKMYRENHPPPIPLPARPPTKQ